jgi:hypothetical protein
MDTRYELVLAPAAVRALLSLSDPARMALAVGLGTELLNGPNARKEAFYDADLRTCRREKAVYTATPLSYDAFVAVHRPLSEDELARLRREKGRRRALARGFHVLDILHLTTAFTRGAHLVGSV